MSNQDDTKTIATAAEAAAAWWAEQVGAPVFRNVDASSSRQDQTNGGFAGMMASLIADKHPVSSEQGEKFVAALIPRIQTRIDRGWCSLSVDYGPCGELREAADEAGINTSRFPWKTHMSVTRDYVTASLGYRAPDRLIWTAPDWVRPPCNMQRYEPVGEDYVCRNEVCSLLKFHEDEHGSWVPDPFRCEECGGTYTDHYARPTVYLGHSWRPVIPS